MPESKSTNPPEMRRPGGRGHRTGELRNARKLDPTANRVEVRKRLQVLREPIWEIQPSETSIAYEAFRLYRGLGPSRTQRRVSEMLGLKNPRNPMTLADWSSKYRWVERARAYDADIDVRLLKTEEEEQRAGARKWVARQQDIREMEYTVAMALAEKVREMLRYPVSRVTRRKETADGKKVFLTIIEPARWDWKSAADILARIGYQARLGADMVTDGARAPTPDLTDRGVSDIDAWLNEIGVTGNPQSSEVE